MLDSPILERVGTETYIPNPQLSKLRIVRYPLILERGRKQIDDDH